MSALELIIIGEPLTAESALKLGLIIMTEDTKEGSQAFIEKRHAVWKGR